MEKTFIWEYLEDVEVAAEYAGYDGDHYSVAEAITVMIVGSLCGLRNTRRKVLAYADRTKVQLGEKPCLAMCYYRKQTSPYW